MGVLEQLSDYQGWSNYESWKVGSLLANNFPEHYEAMRNLETGQDLKDYVYINLHSNILSSDVTDGELALVNWQEVLDYLKGE